MLDLRPAFYVIGLMLVTLAGLMLIPALVDLLSENGNAGAFFSAALINAGTGAVLTLTTRNAVSMEFETRQAYVLTTLAWIIVPYFGSIPFQLGAPDLDLVDAYYEAVSGITTTGATVITQIDDLPAGANLWRGMLNGIGGLGIAFVAMIFLPVMRVGGMQFFRVQGYDTFGKLLPRASDIALSLLGVYVGLIVLCLSVYSALGMPPLEAAVAAMATISTGGFTATQDSFSGYSAPIEYAAVIFMLLGALPYIRYVQLVAGDGRPLWRDSQTRAMLRWLAGAVALVMAWHLIEAGRGLEETFRTALFNLVSIMTTTGFSSGDFADWGGFAILMAFTLGMIGGCSGSSSAALSVFRVQVILAALRVQVQQIRAPSRVIPVKYDGRTIEPETMDTLILYTTAYILLIGLLSVTLTLFGIDTESALFAAWSALSNGGYAYGPLVEATGTFQDFPTITKCILIFGMLMGRVALLSAFVLLMPRFWRG